jgi:hypothetical protein
MAVKDIRALGGGAFTSCLREDGRTTGINPTELGYPCKEYPTNIAERLMRYKVHPVNLRRDRRDEFCFVT